MTLLRHFLIALSAGIAMWMSAAAAAQMYVTDELKLTVRSEPNTRSSILTVIQSGTSVDVLEESEEWVRIKLANESEGWVQKRYLTNQETADRKLARLENIHRATTKQNADLLQKNKQLNKDIKQLRNEFQQQRKNLEELEAAHQSLKTESAEFLALKSDYEKARSKLTNQSQKLTTLQDNVAKLQTRRTIYWFLTGAGVLFFGFIIGYSTKRQRRKSTLL